MPGFEKQVGWMANFDFTDPTATAWHHDGNFTAAGDIAIGTGLSSPLQQIAVGHLVGAGGITINYVSPNLTIDGSGAGTPITFQADAGTAQKFSVCCSKGQMCRVI